jgi:hypothetical protein
VIATYLFTVSDIFNIPERGIVLAPGIPSGQPIPPGSYVGRNIILRRPNGTQMMSSIQAVELLDLPLDALTNQGLPPMPIIVPASIAAGDVPSGTEVWLD